MANIASAKKRAKQSEQKRIHNTGLRSKLRTFMKKVVLATEAGNLPTAQEAFKEAVPVIDRMASKGIIHKGTASRYKSRLNARVKKLFQASQQA